MPIPANSTVVHGISDATVAAAPGFTGVKPALDAFLAGAIVVGHTINYDITILEGETRLAGLPWRPLRALDVRMLARAAGPVAGAL